MNHKDYGLEVKYALLPSENLVTEGSRISGYASIFGKPDQGGDIVMRGAFGDGLATQSARGVKVKMLWQHDPNHPIGVWDEIREDEQGLFVKGHILPEVQAGREALELLRAGAVDGLSIGYKTKTAVRDDKGARLLKSVELWEVSLVTFPMLIDARAELANEWLGQKSHEAVASLIGELRGLRAYLANSNN